MFGPLKAVAGPYHSVTATSAWGPRTRPHSPLGDCCNCEATLSHTCSISSATVGQGDARDSEVGPVRILPLYPESPEHSLHGNATLGDPLISLIHLEGSTSQNKVTVHLFI